jgi:hypothetical protein
MYDYRQQPGVYLPIPGFPSYPGGTPGGGNVDRRLDRLERQVQQNAREIERLERRVERLERRPGGGFPGGGYGNYPG